MRGWKKAYSDLLNFNADLGEDFHGLFSPQIFGYSVREAFLFFSSFTLATYAVLANKIEHKAQNKFAEFQLNHIFDRFCAKDNISFNELVTTLEQRQNAIINIIAKVTAKVSNPEEGLLELTDTVYRNVFNDDEEQLELVHPLLFKTIGDHLGKALNTFRGQ